MTWLTETGKCNHCTRSKVLMMHAKKNKQKIVSENKMIPTGCHAALQSLSAIQFTYLKYTHLQEDSETEENNWKVQRSRLWGHGIRGRNHVQVRWCLSEHPSGDAGAGWPAWKGTLESKGLKCVLRTHTIYKIELNYISLFTGEKAAPKTCCRGQPAHCQRSQWGHFETDSALPSYECMRS